MKVTTFYMIKSSHVMLNKLETQALRAVHVEHRFDMRRCKICDYNLVFFCKYDD